MNIVMGLNVWQFYVGLVVGYVLRHLYCQVKARWLDKHRPNADGTAHRRPLINRTMIGATLALGAVLFSLIKVQTTSNRTDVNTTETRQLAADTKQLADTTQKCQQTLAESIRSDRQLQLENDALAAVERDLNSQEAEAIEDQSALVIDPPPNIAALHTTDPAYQAWAKGVNANYVEKLNDIRTRRDAATAHREAVVAERNRHPVPDPNCGKPR